MDRAYIYWRMLSNSPQKTKYVVLCDKATLAVDSYNLYDEEFVDKLIGQMSTLSSVYHKTPEDIAFMQKKQATSSSTPKPEEKKGNEVAAEEDEKKKEGKGKEKAKKPKKKVEDD
mmetsp:Transcript_45836/g.33574  ORF Transcript_45836/g.33574 Transcript_45836/m.33574 type:complete len:115 (+) Transcript_45836:1578-1922(+)